MRRTRTVGTEDSLAMAQEAKSIPQLNDIYTTKSKVGARAESFWQACLWLNLHWEIIILNTYKID